MDNVSAKVRVSIKDGLFEIEGSEDFVSKQIENLKGLFTPFPSTEADLTSPPTSTTADKTGDEQPSIISTLGTTTDKALEYVHVISIDKGIVKILKPIPGKDLAKKMVNAVVLYLFGKSLQGENEAPFKELRQICKQLGCLDGVNFASKMKTKRLWINVNGTGKNKTASLTVPGLVEAKILANGMKEP